MDQINNFLVFTGLPNCHSNKVIAAYFIHLKKSVNDAINEYYRRPETARAIKNNVSNYEKYYTYYCQGSGCLTNDYTSAGSRKVLEIFNKYKEREVNAFGISFIGIDGTIEYLNDLGIEPEEVDALVLAFYLKAKEVGIFEKDDFISGWCNVEKYDMSGMSVFIRQKANQMYQGGIENELFVNVYRFTFGYVLDKQDKANIQKQLPVEDAVEYWKLLLPSFFDALQGFCDWLLNDSNRKTIKRDEWNMVPSFLTLAQDGNESLLEKYNEEDAWPILMDDYVDTIANNM